MQSVTILSLLVLFLLSSVLLGASGKHPWAATDYAGTTMKTVVYKQTQQANLEMFLHFPKDWKASDKRPAIVFFFGGGWNGGSTMQFERQAVHFASRGLVTARADYRVKGTHGVAPDACVEDAKSAVRYLRAHAAELGVDPSRIAASGGSAGGHLAICTAVVDGLEAPGEDAKISSAPNALVLFNPVLATHEGPLVVKNAAVARQISPILHLTDKTPPMIVFFGEKDRFYQKGGREARALCEKLKLNAQWKVYPGLDHGFFNNPPHYEATVRQADGFLVSLGYLKGAPAMSTPIHLTSPAFTQGQPIPKKHTGEGADLSPALGWSGAPAAAKSLALLVDDPDAPVGDWVHWLLYNIPATTATLPEGVTVQGAPGVNGQNSWKAPGYRGPMPPPGRPHRYFFKLYALDADLALPAGLTKADFLKKISGHVLAEGQLMGTYKR